MKVELLDVHAPAGPDAAAKLARPDPGTASADAEALAKTIVRFNEFAEAGKDAYFKDARREVAEFERTRTFLGS